MISGREYVRALLVGFTLLFSVMLVIGLASGATVGVGAVLYSKDSILELSWTAFCCGLLFGGALGSLVLGMLLVHELRDVVGFRITEPQIPEDDESSVNTSQNTPAK